MPKIRAVCISWEDDSKPIVMDRNEFLRKMITVNQMARHLYPTDNIVEKVFENANG